jgi:hypothetical protein
MMRRIPDVPVGGWLLNGVRYQSEAEYRVALDKRNDRRARILARISVEAGELLTDPAVEAVRRYRDQLAPFWSAEHGWSSEGPLMVRVSSDGSAQAPCAHPGEGADS